MSRSRTTFATIDAPAMAALFSSPSTTAVCTGACRPSRKPATSQTPARGDKAAGAAVLRERADLHHEAVAGGGDLAVERRARQLDRVLRIAVRVEVRQDEPAGACLGCDAARLRRGEVVGRGLLHPRRLADEEIR